ENGNQARGRPRYQATTGIAESCGPDASPFWRACPALSLSKDWELVGNGERNSSKCLHATSQVRPLPTRETPWQRSKRPRRCDRERPCRSGDHKKVRRRVF